MFVSLVFNWQDSKCWSASLVWRFPTYFHLQNSLHIRSVIRLYYPIRCLHISTNITTSTYPKLKTELYVVKNDTQPHVCWMECAVDLTDSRIPDVSQQNRIETAREAKANEQYWGLNRRYARDCPPLMEMKSEQQWKEGHQISFEPFQNLKTWINCWKYFAFFY